MEVREVPAGETLFSQGEIAREFYVLLQGAARVERGVETIRTLGPGDFFGEIALVTRSRRTATVTATEPSRLVVYDEPAFRQLLERNQAFSSRIWRAAADRLES
jgi:CRP-like cAMP-binding protein